MTSMHPQNAYTGEVDVGGPAQIRELPGLTVTKVAVGPMDNNAYLLRCTQTGEQCLIDAAAEPERLIALLAGHPLATVITTHRHRDHWQGLAEVVAATGARTVAGAGDSDAIPVSTSRVVRDGDSIEVGTARLQVIELRGHTAGAIALRYDDPHGHSHLFTGDSLFPGGPGRTTSPEDFTSLMDDLETRVFAVMDDGTWVYPGHGNDTGLGAERPHLAAWRARGW